MKFAIAQTFSRLGDIVGNTAMIIEVSQRAVGLGCDLVVFPELTVTGYLPGDQLLEPNYPGLMLKALSTILDASRDMPGITMVFGMPTANIAAGKRWFNSAIAVREGLIVANAAKQCLPTYNEFDERRYFEPGEPGPTIVDVAGIRIGMLICEDAWADDSTDYQVSPMGQASRAGVELVLSINASPSAIGKRETRHRVMSEACQLHQVPMIYVNQVGGHDHLVYDGASFVVDPARGVLGECARFESELVVMHFDPRAGFSDESNTMLPAASREGLPPAEFYRRQIVRGLRDYAAACGFKKVVVGSSGGIDSALTIALAAEALGPENVAAITMPSRVSSKGSVDDSDVLCRNLGVQLHIDPITYAVQAAREEHERVYGLPLTGLALQNIQARLRAVKLMTFSNMNGHLVLTTGNKSEISVGFFTAAGDVVGGYGLIGDVYKTEVYEIARRINETAGREIIPAEVIDKPPSAELEEGQVDSDSLPPYDTLDPMLRWLVENEKLDAAAFSPVAKLLETESGKAVVDKVCRLISASEWKRRQAPVYIKLRPRAFGTGRQMPITAVWNRS